MLPNVNGTCNIIIINTSRDLNKTHTHFTRIIRRRGDYTRVLRASAESI